MLAVDEADTVLKRQEEENAMLRERLAQREEQVDVLHGEVRRLQAHGKELETTVARLSTAVNAAPAAATADTGVTPAVLQAAQTEAEAARQQLASAQSQAQQARQQVTSLQDELARERLRRENVEGELGRLKQETSTAPLHPPVDEAALGQARSEVDALRAQLDKERAERERLAQQLTELQAQAQAPAPPADAPAPDPELQQRLNELQARQEEIVASAERDLAASREREAALQSQLAALQEEVTVARTRAAQVAVPVSAMEEARAENAELRQQVAAMVRNNEELNAKLKTAQRVADLIFKMRSGQVESVPAPRR
ncbi:MAG: hypothetical protein HY699_08735 [Deltaproteobacteria bacterium]|nr:hypothetical protein [Deltaproteobacteria bacterium]